MMDSSIRSIGEEGKGNAIGDVHADHMCPGRAITSGNDELLSPKNTIMKAITVYFTVTTTMVNSIMFSYKKCVEPISVTVCSSQYLLLRPI